MIRFDDILRMRQKELKHYLAGHLKKLGYETVKKKGFLYAEGTVPVLLVAHLDTVHNELPHIICRSEDGRYIMSPQGIGGDDRCGVYMILQIISEVRCHVLFCEDEETGGQGAKAFERSGIQIDVNYIVEVDRRGNNDAVFYNCDNPKFSEFVCSFGFREAMGSFSDISVVAPYLKTAAVNISAGYYNVILLPMPRLNTAIQILTPIEAISTASAAALNCRGTGCIILSTDERISSPPMIRMIKETMSAQTYSSLP